VGNFGADSPGTLEDERAMWAAHHSVIAERQRARSRARQGHAINELIGGRWLLSVADGLRIAATATASVACRSSTLESILGSRAAEDAAAHTGGRRQGLSLSLAELGSEAGVIVLDGVLSERRVGGL
jgi:hypothetical protein